MRRMKSPFPGMDPYLEPYWSDVHVTLIAAIKRNLQPMMPDGLVARAEEQVMPEGDEEDGTATHRSRPAVAVTFE